MSLISDKKNRIILDALQKDATLSVDELAERVSLSRNACWRRVKTLEESGVIKAKVALLDAEQLGLSLIALMLIRTNQHESQWLAAFKDTVLNLPEIVTAWRMSGDLDYVLQVRVESVKGYDTFYQKLITHVPMSDVSASFVLEEIKNTTELPLR